MAPEIPDTHGADVMSSIDPFPREIYGRRRSFLQSFVRTKGPPQIILLCLLLAIGFGSTIGVVPAVMTDRFARLHHGYDGDFCGDFRSDESPQACLDGSADAQNAVATEQLISNMLTFFTSSLVGSLSDEYGRRGILLLGVFLSALSPFFLVLTQLYPSMSPFWYYFVGSINGVVSWITVALSALSDVMPKRWRAPSFGLLLAGFSLGFAIAPQLALLLGHLQVSVLSCCMALLGLTITVMFFPETLPPETAVQARVSRERLMEGMTEKEKFRWSLYRPIWEITILNRSRLFRLLSALAFFSGMVQTADRTLLIYYVEERLDFGDKDVAIMFMLVGFLGIFVQGVLLKCFSDVLGERRLVALCFTVGAIHNVLYGIAKTKQTIYLAVSIGSLVGMSFPTISAIKSNNVQESEQGRIQGALYSLSSVASALGPIFLRSIYHFTRDGYFLGPGSMFVVAGGLYLVAVYCALALPDEANSRSHHHTTDTEDDEPLNVATPLI